jgi:hypothetical protein
MYDAMPPEGPDTEEGVCPVCQGILPGFIGFPGEGPCSCPGEDIDPFQPETEYDTLEERDLDREIDNAVDAEIERRQIERAE